MISYCDADCNNCGYGKNTGCKGCVSSKGCPFGKQCFIAKYIQNGGTELYNQFLRTLVAEINSLNVAGLPKIKELVPLNGAFVNLEYPMPNGKTVKFLDDKAIYLGTQIECEFSDGEADRCFGIVADMNMIIVAEYGVNGSNPQLILYKSR